MTWSYRTAFLSLGLELLVTTDTQESFPSDPVYVFVFFPHLYTFQVILLLMAKEYIYFN